MTHNRKFRIDPPIAHRLRRHNKVQLLNAGCVLIAKQPVMPPERFEYSLNPFDHRPIAHA
jgi:hypothetical protein